MRNAYVKQWRELERRSGVTSLAFVFFSCPSETRRLSQSARILDGPRRSRWPAISRKRVRGTRYCSTLILSVAPILHLLLQTRKTPLHAAARRLSFACRGDRAKVIHKQNQAEEPQIVVRTRGVSFVSSFPPTRKQ